MAESKENQDSQLREPVDTQAEIVELENTEPSRFEQIKQQVSEDDDAPIGSLTFGKVLGGDILSAQMVRSQVWLIMLIALFSTVYVASRYQCQQDMLDISKKEKELTDAKYRALSSSSALTERSRESHVTKALRTSGDSLLLPSDQPPYIIDVPEK
jgi:hypothetical protein